jgi:hypothetical protein
LTVVTKNHSDYTTTTFRRDFGVALMFLLLANLAVVYVFLDLPTDHSLKTHVH